MSQFQSALFMHTCVYIYYVAAASHTTIYVIAVLTLGLIVINSQFHYVLFMSSYDFMYLTRM